MILLDGKKTAGEIRAELKIKIENFERIYSERIGLAVVMIGNNAASQIYVRNKMRACQEVGIRSFTHYLPETVAQEEAAALIHALARDESVHGILVQLPLPAQLNGKELLSLIPAEKDVDGFSEVNMGKLALGQAGTVACTPRGVMELLARYGISVAGKRAVVVGRSRIVGRPMSLLLLNADATVTVCHSRTQNLKEECVRADILISAVGKANFIGADMVKDGAVIVDVGMNRLEGGALCGDVDFEAVKGKASYLTPVPGGVGPMTIAMLLCNVFEAAERASAYSKKGGMDK